MVFQGTSCTIQLLQHHPNEGRNNPVIVFAQSIWPSAIRKVYWQINFKHGMESHPNPIHLGTHEHGARLLERHS